MCVSKVAYIKLRVQPFNCFFLISSFPSPRSFFFSFPVASLCIGQIEASTCPPPGISRAFDTFSVPGRREFYYQSLPGGGEFELHPRFHVKSLAWRAMGDAVLEDFRGKDCAFVANWLRGKGLNKLCGVFEVFRL